MKKVMRENNVTVYMDLDGTVTDVFERYCGIFNLYIQRYGFQIRSDEYKKLRHLGFSDSMILQSKFKIISVTDEFRAFKQKRLENRDWLSRDRIIGNIDVLKKYNSRFVLITQRNDREEALHQIQELGLDKVFHEVVVLKPLFNGNCKYEYLKGKAEKRDYIIGDSLVELECARHLGMNGCFVKTGLFGANVVKGEKIFENYQECIRVIFMEEKKNG